MSHRSLANEFASFLFHVDDSLVIPFVGFAMLNYILSHSESLPNESGYGHLIRFLNIDFARHEESELLLCLQNFRKDNSDGNNFEGLTSDQTARLKLFMSFSPQQTKAVVAWIDIAKEWPYSYPYQFDLASAKSWWQSLAALGDKSDGN